jgi:hypothetical protein
MQTRAKSLEEKSFQMNSLDLLSEMPVVNRFGEKGHTENGIWHPWLRRTQQLHLYKARIQRDFLTPRPNGEQVSSGDWLTETIWQRTFSGP